MSGTSFDLLLLIAIVALAGVGACIRWVVFFSDGPEASALTEQSAARILRSETDIVRAAVEVHARGLRQELGRTLTGFQDVTLRAFGTLRGGMMFKFALSASYRKLAVLLPAPAESPLP